MGEPVSRMQFGTIICSTNELANFAGYMYIAATVTFCL